MTITWTPESKSTTQTFTAEGKSGLGLWNSTVQPWQLSLPWQYVGITWTAESKS